MNKNSVLILGLALLALSGSVFAKIDKVNDVDATTPISTRSDSDKYGGFVIVGVDTSGNIQTMCPGDAYFEMPLSSVRGEIAQAYNKKLKKCRLSCFARPKNSFRKTS